jgi:hypothetical protein
MTFPKFLIGYYPNIFVLAAGIVALLTFRRSYPFHFKALLIFVFLYSIVDTIGNVMAAYYKQNNLFLYNILYGVQYIVIAFFYYYILQNLTLKKMIKGFFFVFPLFFIINSIVIQGFYPLQTYSHVLGGGFILLLAVAYIWQVYTSLETQSIFRDPVFWISLSLLFYFGLNVPYLGMLNYLLNLKSHPNFALDYYTWVIYISDCLRSSLLIIGFLCMKAAMK